MARGLQASATAYVRPKKGNIMDCVTPKQAQDAAEELGALEDLAKALARAWLEEIPSESLPLDPDSESGKLLQRCVDAGLIPFYDRDLREALRLAAGLLYDALRDSPSETEFHINVRIPKRGVRAVTRKLREAGVWPEDDAV